MSVYCSSILRWAPLQFYWNWWLINLVKLALLLSTLMSKRLAELNAFISWEISQCPLGTSIFSTNILEVYCTKSALAVQQPPIWRLMADICSRAQNINSFVLPSKDSTDDTSICCYIWLFVPDLTQLSAFAYQPEVFTPPQAFIMQWFQK